MNKALEQARELVRILEEQEERQKTTDEGMERLNGVKLSTIEVGKTFMIGEHEFIVLEQDAEDCETRVISKDFMAAGVEFGSSRDYKTSNLKKVIEEQIQPIIEAAVGVENIVTDVVDLTSVDMQNEFGGCTYKVRPLTFDEVRRYNDLLVNEELSGWWWTCTPWSTEARGWKCSIAVVSPSGYFDYYIFDFDFGVRPFCILKSNIFVSRKGN